MKNLSRRFENSCKIYLEEMDLFEVVGGSVFFLGGEAVGAEVWNHLRALLNPVMKFRLW